MKKFIAILACLTLALTMCVGLSVSAAETAYGTPTLTFSYIGDNASGYARILVSYSGFENFEELDDSDGITVTGIAAFQINVATSADYTYQGGSKSTGLTAPNGKTGTPGKAWADVDGGIGTVTATDSDVFELRFLVNDTTKATTITPSIANFSIKKYVSDAEISETQYTKSDFTVVPAVIPAKVAADVAPWDVTYAAATNGKISGAALTAADGKVNVKVTPKIGYKVAAIKVAGVANADALAAVDAKLGGTVELTLTADAEISADFEAIDAEKKSLTFVKPFVDSTEKVGATFGKIVDNGKTIKEVGMYLKDADGNGVASSKIAKPGYFKNNTVTAADTLFGVKWINMPAGTYKAQTYVIYSDDSEVLGDEVTIVVE